jgi:hypothetical protein
MRTLIAGFALSALLALALQPPAGAQTANSSSGSSSSSSSGSSSGSSATGVNTGNSTSGSVSGNRQRASQTTNTPITFNSTTPDRLTTNSNGTGTYTNNTNNSGFTSSDVTVRTTPTVYAPPVSGGNPCTLAVSGGVSVIGWGAAAGGTFVDEDCANRQKIAMIHNAGYAQAARELMCNDKATYMAFRGTATPCQPRAQFDGVPPMAAVQTAPVVVTPAAPPPPIQRTTSTPPRRCTGPNDQGPCVQGS